MGKTDFENFDFDFSHRTRKIRSRGANQMRNTVLAHITNINQNRVFKNSILIFRTERARADPS